MASCIKNISLLSLQIGDTLRGVVAQVDELLTNKEREELTNTNMPYEQEEPSIEPKLQNKSSCFSLCKARCRLGENGASRQEGLKALPDGLLDILEALYIWHFYTIFGLF